jgi:hypothetical protein
MKKNPAKKRSGRASKKALSLPRRKPKRQPVAAQAIADFMARPEGASMAELVKEFGIEPHPMRAKVFYVKHTLGYAVERVDGRYHATAPAVV